MEETIFLFLTNAFNSYAAMLPGFLVSALAFIGTCHLVIAPIQAAVKAIVDATSTKADDELYEKVTRSKAYVVAVKVVAWISGLKLPTTKKVAKTEDKKSEVA